MKAKLLSLFILIALVIAVPAQDVEAKKKGSKSINSVFAVGIGSNTLLAMYEKRMSKNNSLTFKGEYYYTYDYWNGYGLSVSYRWYLKDIFQDGKRPIEGLSAGPVARLTMWSYDADNLHYSYDGGTSLSIGGEVSYKWLFNNKYTIEPLFEIGFNLLNPDGFGSMKPYGLSVSFGYVLD